LQVALRTNGFHVGERLNHFDRHRDEYPWIDQFAYEEAADEFLTKEPPPSAKECLRRNGARIRYDTASFEFGIVSTDNHIVTYFYRRTNGLEYFKRECTR
jgi:predicted TIM-barrel fold metal-dependent hydrolase